MMAKICPFEIREAFRPTESFFTKLEIFAKSAKSFRRRFRSLPSQTFSRDIPKLIHF